jgi:hypothetical protein
MKVFYFFFWQFLASVCEKINLIRGIHENAAVAAEKLCEGSNFKDNNFPFFAILRNNRSE